MGCELGVNGRLDRFFVRNLSGIYRNCEDYRGIVGNCRGL